MSDQPYPEFHDTLRTLVRGFHWPNEQMQQNALLSIDAHAAGADSTDAYVKDLREREAQARRQANPDAPETDKERADRLEAELTRLRATQAAQTPHPVAPPAPPPAVTTLPQ